MWLCFYVSLSAIASDGCCILSSFAGSSGSYTLLSAAGNCSCILLSVTAGNCSCAFMLLLVIVVLFATVDCDYASLFITASGNGCILSSSASSDNSCTFLSAACNCSCNPLFAYYYW